jgi:indole-3-glycerol phosphate synthase
MGDFLDVLALEAKETVKSGYYQTLKPTKHMKVSLKKAIANCKLNAVIGEIKAASPSLGLIRKETNSYQIARAMRRGGAVGISVLTEPKHFKGSLPALNQAREAVKLPILMKDIIISNKQLEKAANIGADAVLLIQGLFERGYPEMTLDEMIAFAHSRSLEVLIETHTEEEFRSATKTSADLIGINNRNLATLKIDLNSTKDILEKNGKKGKAVISESGIKTEADLRFLRECGASAFLIGSSIMLAENIEKKVREFVNA